MYTIFKLNRVINTNSMQLFSGHTCKKKYSNYFNITDWSNIN